MTCSSSPDASPTEQHSLDEGTLELLTGSLRELFAGSSGPSQVSAALADLGWEEVAATDPAAATTLLFTEHGRALASSRVLDDVVLAPLDPHLPPPTGPRAFLYPHPVPGGGTATGSARGLLLGMADGLAEVVAPIRAPGSRSITEFLVLPADVVARAGAPIGGFDPSGWLAVETVEPGGAPRVEVPGEVWTRAEAAGRRALASEIAGIGEAAIALATAHTSARVQYGRPIGSFQAVRHRLSEAHVAVVATRKAVDAAWQRAGDVDGGAWEARIAKQRAGRAQAEVLRHTVQVLGAMGLTFESEMHGYVTRGAALDGLLGDHASLSTETGADLMAGADVRPVVEI